MASSAPKKLGPLGGSGGKDFDMDMDITNITRIVKITVHHFYSTAVDGIAIDFKRSGSDQEETLKWGKEGANLSEFNLEPSEYIMSISGHVGDHNGIRLVRSLIIKTNLKTYGSFGIRHGTPFEYSANGGEIIGFHGRAGDYLYALGVYVKARTPPRPLDGLKEEELYMNLFLHQNWGGPRKNQEIVVNSIFGAQFGETAINDWAILDKRDPGANLVARGQGLHTQAGWNKKRWYCSFNIVFEDDQWKGSSLEVKGWFEDDAISLQWAIVGGTGHFTLAQGVIFGEKQSQDNDSRIIKLSINVLYRPVKKPNMA